MATRGMESNSLYVDTSHDPEANTAHEPAERTRGLEVLRNVVGAPGVDRTPREVRGRVRRLLEGQASSNL